MLLELVTIPLNVLYIILVPIVIQSQLGYMTTQSVFFSAHEPAKLSSLFSAFRKCFKVQK